MEKITGNNRKLIENCITFARKFLVLPEPIEIFFEDCPSDRFPKANNAAESEGNRLFFNKQLISLTQNENNPLTQYGKTFHLNIDYLYSFKTCDGNKALFGILGRTNRNEIEKNVRHYYGKKIQDR